MNKVIFAATLAAACVASTPIRCAAADSEPREIRCTCYIEPGVTKSGHQTHEGVIAGRKILGKSQLFMQLLKMAALVNL